VQQRFEGKVVLVTGKHLKARASVRCVAYLLLSSCKSFPLNITIITGGGAGIGTGICERFHAEGAKVWIVDTNREAAEAAAAALNQLDNGKEHARRAVTAIVDISQETAVSALLDQIEVTDGRLDVLVNNAARFVLKSAEMAEERDWDNVLASNVKGYGLVSKHAIRVMKATKTRGSSTEACKCLRGGVSLSTDQFAS